MKYFEGFLIAQPLASLMDQFPNLSQKADALPELWQVGQLVTLAEPHYGPHNPCGSVGVVYVIDTEDPEMPYVGILMESGDDLNLIDALQVHNSFISLGIVPFDYEFSSCQTLMADQQKGLFLPCFQAAHRLMHKDE